MKKLSAFLLACAAVSAGAQQTMLESNLLSIADISSENAVISDAGYLCDGNDNTVSVISGDGETVSVVCAFPRVVTVTGINIVAGGDVGKAPSRVTLYGRNDDSEQWSQIGRAMTLTITLPFTNAVGRSTAVKSYSQYKLDLGVAGSTSAVAEIAEIQLLGYDNGMEVLSDAQSGSYSSSDGDIDYEGIKATASVGKQAYDNGVMGDNAWQAWIGYDFESPTVVSAYTLGGDALASRNNRPAVWELLASDDGNEWVTLDMRANAPDLYCDNFAIEYSLGKYDTAINFNEVADKLYSMIDSKFYRNYYDGKYLIDTWNKDESKCNTAYNYWWMAHAVDAYTDAYRRTGQRQHELHARNIRSGMYIAYDAGRRDLWNSFYDDMEWMCLACIRASETLSMSTDGWLSEAKQLFDWIWEGWDETTGGILWNNGSQRGVLDSKNSCSNGPAMIAAALLYQKTGEEHYLEKAVRIFEFMYAHNLFDDGFVKDGPMNDNRGWTFTYNQGTWVGGLLELYRITKDTKYRDIAVDLIDKSIESPWYSPRGIMCESGKGDGGLFKGIYVRYITEWVLSGLLDTEHTVRYSSYLVNNARSLYMSALLKPDMTIMANWRDRGEYKLEEYCASVVLSGLFLIEGVNRLRSAGILNDDYSVANPNHGRAFRHYRLKATDNFGGSKVDFCSFALLGASDTGVDNVTVDMPVSDDDRWYTITGMRVTQPTAPGIYIHNRKKIVVR